MLNCLARISPTRRVDVPLSDANHVAAQAAAEPVRPPPPPPLPLPLTLPLPAVPVLSASAQARWWQVCNRLPRNQVDGYGLLKPGARLDFSFAERAEIGRALEHLQVTSHFNAAVTAACILGDPVNFGAVETLIRHGILDPDHITDGRTMLQTACLYSQNASPSTMLGCPLNNVSPRWLLSVQVSSSQRLRPSPC